MGRVLARALWLGLCAAACLAQLRLGSRRAAAECRRALRRMGVPAAAARALAAAYRAPADRLPGALWRRCPLGSRSSGPGAPPGYRTWSGSSRQ